jgi:hypothetical protein
MRVRGEGGRKRGVKKITESEKRVGEKGKVM